MKRGTVVLVPFPFTDLSAYKVRPALAVSRSDRADPDAVFAFITSSGAQAPSAADLLVEPTHPDFSSTGLKTRSLVRLDKLVTLDTGIPLGTLGEFSSALMQDVDDRLRFAFEL